MNNRLISYLEKSSIGSLLMQKDVTDVSFNGKNIFYMTNEHGRQKSDINMDLNYAIDFVRQIANLSEKQFSFSEPFLDISAGKYRINAVHSSIVKVDEEKSISFSIRIASLKNRIEEDESFMSEDEKRYLESLINKQESIVICGGTGSGKTELQKYLLSRLPDNSRVIVIDNIQELEVLRENENLDLTLWQVTPNMHEKTFRCLIKNALRSNPDWLVISESRGEEMNDILNSVMTGHPVITTIHSNDIKSAPNRIIRMAQLSDKNQSYSDIERDVIENIKNYVFLKRGMDSDNNIKRYISSIGRIEKGNMKIVFNNGGKYEKD